jgi:ribosome-binding factor A
MSGWSSASRRDEFEMVRRNISKGPGQRQLRVGEMIRHALAEILMRSEIADPDFDGHDVTITEVKLSPDLRNATIYAVPFGQGDPETLLAGLVRHHKFLRGELAKRVDLKYMPNISFEIDRTFEEAERIDKILSSPEVRRDLGKS